MSSQNYVTTGDVITTELGFLRGHGTMMLENNKLVATVSGFIERVNKLISVRPLNPRYQAETGDVVVGRIVEVADKRWRVDVHSRQHAILMLSAINLPGGVQRRRTDEDALQMRTFFKEDDLISAEVQSILSDGVISLHTRSMKYGKLSHGQLVKVPSALVKRSKQHFQTLSCGVEMILGINGYIWLYPASSSSSDQNQHNDNNANKNGHNDKEYTGDKKSTLTSSITEEKDEKHIRGSSSSSLSVSLERIARVRNSIIALSRMFIAIYGSTITDVYEESINLGLAAKSLLDPALLQTITQTALARVKGQL